MKFLTALLSLLLITYTYQDEVVALSECEVENDSTTKSTAKITCSSDKDINNVAFVDNYLKLNGNAAGNATSKTATLGTCTAACTGSGTITCTISCQKVTGADAGAYYVLTKIEEAVKSGVFSTTGKTSDGVTIANKDGSKKVYEGQAAASNNGANTNNSNSSNNGDSDDSCSFIKYHFIGLMCLLLF